MQSKVTATGVIANPDTPEAELTVEITFDCPSCGKATLRIPGHHLRLVRDIAVEYVDRFPELTRSDIRTVSKQEFRMGGPTDPSMN